MADRFDLVIIGMGSAGMVAAEFACGLGVKVAVVERDRVGGDCLWTGCVPSKALLASSRAAQQMRHADRLGLPAIDVEIDTALVWKRMRAVQADIATTDDDPERFHDMGVDIIHGHTTITGPNTIVVTHPDKSIRELEPRFVLIATGSRPVAPPIDGLEEAGYLTTESVFELDRAPDSIVIIGGGPTGVELAQAFNRLDVGTTLLQDRESILPLDERELVSMLEDQLMAEGVHLRLGVEVEKISIAGGSKFVHGTEGGEAQTWTAREVLVATGRRPNVDGLGLDEVGVIVHADGIEVDERLRSSVPTIYAAGDVAGRHRFTHSAAYEGVRAVRDMFLPGKGRANESVPWCTFTDPELAHTGMTVREAEAKFGDDVQVWRQDLIHSDRARIEAATVGAILVVTHKNKILGAHVLAPAAGEMIHELALAIREGVSFSSLGALMHVYPTLSTGVSQLAAEAAFEKAESFRWLVKKGRR